MLKRIISIGFLMFHIGGCTPVRLSSGVTPTFDDYLEPLSFINENVNHSFIRLVWLQVPDIAESGSITARFFIATDDPPQPVVPNTTNLKCLLTSPNQVLDMGPITLPMTFPSAGQFQGSYTWPAIPACDQSYMDWNYTMEISGQLDLERASIEIAIKHIGLNVPGEYLRTDLIRDQTPDRSPRIRCDQTANCSPVFYLIED